MGFFQRSHKHKPETKNKLSLLRNITSMLTSLARAKSIAIKNKTSEVKGRLVLFTLMNKKVLLSSISNKIHNLLGHDSDKEIPNQNEIGDQSMAIVQYNAMANNNKSYSSFVELEPKMEGYYANGDNEGDDDKYPDLRHSLFDEEEMDFDDDPSGSVIDLVKKTKEEGDEFSLEDEIDHVADLFIKRFHKQMKLQKLESFKRFQEMLERGV